MPTWLADDPTILYMLLGTAALALLVIGWKTRKRRYMAGLAFMLFLAGVVFLLEQKLVSDREQIVQTLEEMRQGTLQRDLDRVFAHISKNFRRGSMDRAAFRQRVDAALNDDKVHEMTLWDLDIRELSREQKTAKVEFRAKVRGSWQGRQEFFLCRSEFVLDPDGRWRMQGFDLFNPAINTNDPIPIPGIGH